MSHYVIAHRERIKPRAQKLATTCWLACFEMMEQWVNGGEEPDYVAAMLRRGGLDVDQCRIEGLANRDLLLAARAMSSLMPWPGLPVAASQIDHALRNRGPLWAAGRWRSSGGHCIVIVAFDAEKHALTYVDPFPEPGSTKAEEFTRPLSWFNAALGKGWAGSIMNWPQKVFRDSQMKMP